jgi:hypothetical protein
MSRHVVVAAVVLLATAGCKKKERYPIDCKEAAALTSPWKDLALPTESGRVCQSSEREARISYLDGDRPDWEKRYEEALVAQGFTRDRCSDLACTFKKGDEKAVVQVFQGKRYVNVTVRR